MTKKIALFLFALFVLIFSIAQKLQAKMPDIGIVAIVNEESITNIDLEERINMMLASAKIPNDRSTRKRLAPQVLQRLINESLYKQEADRLGLKASVADIKRAMKALEQKNNLGPGGMKQFAKNNGISWQALNEQVENQILWQKIISSVIGPNVFVAQEDIEDAKSWMRSAGQAVEYNISSLYISTNNKDLIGKVKEAAGGLTKAARNGADFEVLAEQFSDDQMIASGGKIGWIPVSKLSPRVRQMASTMQEGQVSAPFAVENGLQIIKVNKIRKNRGKKYNKTEVEEILRANELERESRRYMKKLRDNSFVEIRL